MNRRSVITLVSLLSVSLILTIAFFSFQNRGKTAQAELVVAPQSASLTLNGKKVKAGIVRLKPGSYTLVATKSGFETASKVFIASDTELPYVGIVLDSNSPATQNWYRDNIEDQRLAESITGRQSDQNSEKVISKNGLLTKLPYFGPGSEYRIDAGVSVKGSSEPAIYIRSVSEQSKQDALNWIRQQGFNPESMEIIYLPYNAVSPPTEKQEANP